MSLASVHRARRNAAVLGATVLTVGLLFLFPTSTNSSRRPTTHAAAAGVVPPKPQPSGAPRTPSAPSTLVVNGSAADTQFGPVQVQIRVVSRRIVSATAIVYPQSGDQDRQINSYAIPLLQKETLQAQSARIDAVSGATYTSDGYRRSLQAALDAAHLSS